MVKEDKVISVEKACQLIEDNSTVAVGGFVGFGHPEEITSNLEKKIFR